jgi:tRNA pseudouridine38-40 synthase
MKAHRRPTGTPQAFQQKTLRVKLVVEYAGTKYSGWQVQLNARTVQGELNRAVGLATGRPSEVHGSGRTDAGVHAMGQVAHVDVPAGVPLEQLRRRINDELPADINVVAISPAPPRFHARHDAVARSYIYQVARRRTAFAKPFVWWVKEELALAPMREVAAAYVGFHDFRSFTDDDPSQKSTEVQLEVLDFFDDEDLLVVHLEGSHFLWKMVRRVVGVLVAVGRGEIGPADAVRLLDEPSPRVAQLTAPASGLFLERVFYPGEPRDTAIRAAVRVGRW